jgi:hypothetical protein
VPPTSSGRALFPRSGLFRDWLFAPEAATVPAQPIVTLSNFHQIGLFGVAFGKAAPSATHFTCAPIGCWR